MAELKERLRSDLTAAMKGRQTTVVATLRMALAAVTTEEVAGKVARELSDEEVLKVLTREVKKRNEAAEAFAGAGRKEQADAELAEAEVLKSYLPAQLSDDELADVVAHAIATVADQIGEQPGQKQMGQVMKLANAKVAGRGEGGRVAAVVKAKLLG
ncbi:GatB/YqeY domain-containing protein [Kutzneria kofuensis]|uniref:GatB/YqeY domain-containing protein n=1 Tax=Kutzneria kofuensis TaxID=103725 RepID=UPI0031E6A5E2